MKRRSFIGASAGASLLSALPLEAPAQTPRTGRKGLILIGGANRGAYEAGVIQALIESAGISDGQPLDFDLVSGTSIGALNAYLVATAQYTTLRELWLGGIASSNVFRLKPEFETIPDKYSGVLQRGTAAVRLGKGLISNLPGVLDPAPVRAMLDKYVKADAPVHIPLYISTTNLTRQRNQLFSRDATTSDGAQKQSINDQLLAPYSRLARPATDAILHDVLFATAFLPIVLDPIVIPHEDGSPGGDQYVDGGVTSNIPAGIAQICVENLYVVLLFPMQTPDEAYANAVEVGLGVFNTMQWQTIVYQMRLMYEAATRDLPFHPFIIRPQSDLPGKGGDFNDQASMTTMWNLGYADAQHGWQAFVPPPGSFDLPY